MISESGTYALLLVPTDFRCLGIGRLGSLALRPGWYVYVGSAFGPGGVGARLAHHRRLAERPHWHIDYLRPHATLGRVWYTYDPGRREHEWASVLVQLPGAEVALSGFGASDCRCRSHLFRFRRQPSLRGFQRRIRSLFPEHGPVRSITTT